MIVLDILIILMLVVMFIWLVQSGYLFARHGAIRATKPHVAFFWCMMFALLTFVMMVDQVGQVAER